VDIKLSSAEKARLFDKILGAYVGENGLGGMQKSDFDAFLLWHIASGQEEFDPFVLSDWFKIKESRVKTLLETAAVKFSETTQIEAWGEILRQFATAEIDVESLEKGQVRLPLSNAALFRWFQARVRANRTTVQYNRSTEEVTINIDALYQILDQLWVDEALGPAWGGKTLAEAREHIRQTIGRIGKKVGGNDLEDLRQRKTSKLKSRLSAAANLASIGTLLVPVLAHFKDK
jgi:hypothetical protein